MAVPDNSPLVSIILPTYNSARNLAEAVRSVLCQSYTNFELIVVDDGSTEATAAVLAGFTDPRITVLRHPKNYGVARAYNTGLDAARGTFIGFIGSDDAWVPEKLEEETACFSHLPPEYGVVYSDMWAFDPEGNRDYWNSPEILGPGITNTEGTDYQVFCLGNGPALIRRDFMDKAGEFDERFRCFVDLDFLIRLSRVCRFYHLKKPLYIYRSGQGTSANPYEVCRSRLLLLEKYPETAQDRTFLMHQYHQIRHNLRLIEEENGRLRKEILLTGQRLRGKNESVTGNVCRLFDEIILDRLFLAASKRAGICHDGLDALRKRLNPLLKRPGKERVTSGIPVCGHTGQGAAADGTVSPPVEDQSDRT